MDLYRNNNKNKRRKKFLAHSAQLAAADIGLWSLLRVTGLNHPPMAYNVPYGSTVNQTENTHNGDEWQWQYCKSY